MTHDARSTLSAELRQGPPTCGEPHDGFEKCLGPDAGCYALAGSYDDDARYNYPAREKWWEKKAEQAADEILRLQSALMGCWQAAICYELPKGTTGEIDAGELAATVKHEVTEAGVRPRFGART